MFVLLFVYVFGSAINVPGADYVDYLMAGIFVQSMAFSSAGTAVSVADDLAKGVVDRFRTLPMARSAVLVGRTLSDLSTGLIALAVLSVTGLLVGWRVDGSVAEHDRRVRAAPAVRLRHELARDAASACSCATPRRRRARCSSSCSR